MYFKNIKYTCFAIASSAFIFSGAVTASAGGSIGGDCCADLEERVAELEATTVRKGNRKVSLKLYGHINKALMFWEDDAESDTYIVSNSATQTLFGLRGGANVSSDFSVGFRAEFEIDGNDSDFVDQGELNGVQAGFGQAGDPNADESIFNLRHANIWFQSKKLGRVTMGVASSATDGIAEIDLSGSSSASGSSVETWNEGFFIRNSNGDSLLTTPIAISSLIGVVNQGNVSDFSLWGTLFQGNFDGTRNNLVRYDTPTLAGFRISASWGWDTDTAGDENDWDVALRYAGKLGDFQVRAGVGYREGVSLDTDNLSTGDLANVFGQIVTKNVTGSASVLHEPTGLFVTFAAGQREFDAFNAEILGTPVDLELSDITYFYTKAGIYKDFFSIGKTSIYGEYYQIDDVGLEGAAIKSSGTSYGAGIVQHIDAASMQIYLAYKHYEANDVVNFNNNLNLEDAELDIFMAGAKINF